MERAQSAIGRRARLFSPDASARFSSRINRFLISAEIEGSKQEKEPVHLANSGRLSELLQPENRLILEKARGTKRKTAWTAAAAVYQTKLIPLMSVRANGLIADTLLPALFPEAISLRAEQSLAETGNSRFDFLAEEEELLYPVEIKACTLLEEDGVARFPDAPSSRATRHIREMIKIAGNRTTGGKVYQPVLIIALFHHDARSFEANRKRDPDFADALRAAEPAVPLLLPVYESLPSGEAVLRHFLPSPSSREHREKVSPEERDRQS